MKAMDESPWYITAHAVRNYLGIGESGADDGGPIWRRAEREIAAHAQVARLVSDDGDEQVWRTGRVPVMDRPKALRLQFQVRTTPRPEGPLPQLTRITAK